MKHLLLIFLLSASVGFAQTPSYVPTNGLIGWWPFNGNSNDESGNNNNGTVNGATLTTDRFGNLNKAYSFNGVSSVSVGGNNINVTNNFFDTGLNAFTISTWSNSNIIDNTANGGAVQDIIHTNNAAGLGIACNWGSSGKYSIWAMSNPPAGWDILYNKSSVSNFVINQWKHIVMVKSNTTYYIYVDGVLDNTFNTSITAQSYLTGLKFGTYWTGEEAFNGKLDDFGVWNRALTSNEILTLYLGCNVTSTITPSTSNSTLNSNPQFTASSGIVGVTYQWQSDHANFGWTNIPSNSAYSGVTSNILTVNNVQFENHQQQFRVIATYNSCIDTSNIAVLNIADTCILSVTDTLTINTTITGLTPPNNENTIKVFPNPTNDHITINYGNYSLMSGYTLKIINLSGQVLFTTPINQQSSYIDLSNWTGNGIYFVHIIDALNNTVDVRKIVLE